MQENHSDKLVSLYLDCAPWQPDDFVKPDDFMVAVGQKKSNSVYHIAQVKKVPQKNRMIRYYVKVYKTDLITALRRDKLTQQLVTLIWYKR